MHTYIDMHVCMYKIAMASLEDQEALLALLVYLSRYIDIGKQSMT